MAARALAAVAGPRAAAQSGFPLLGASCRRGGVQSYSRSSTQREEPQSAGRDAPPVTTAEQVEAALNRKNVEVVQGERSATVLPDEAADADDAWVPDQDTGVFVPAEEASSASSNGADGRHDDRPGPSVLDQTVFVREEDMEDVERPAVDMADAGRVTK